MSFLSVFLFRRTEIISLHISEEELRKRVRMYPVEAGSQNQIGYQTRGYLVNENAGGLIRIAREQGRGISILGEIRIKSFQEIQLTLSLPNSAYTGFILFLGFALLGGIFSRFQHIYNFMFPLVLAILIYLALYFQFWFQSRRLRTWLLEELMKPASGQNIY